jgi:hypothetical protein
LKNRRAPKFDVLRASCSVMGDECGSVKRVR